MYFKEKTINKLEQDGFTFFLNPHELRDITYHLKKNTYNIYRPYDDAEKCLLYKKEMPNLILYEIKSPIALRHQDILGALFSLQIDEHLFSDIIIENNSYYFYTFAYMKPYFQQELRTIHHANIILIEKNIDLLKDFHQQFDEITIICSSMRIDNTVAKIIHTNRSNIKDLIKNQKILYNDEILINGSKTISENDTFSIRKFGKYRLSKIDGNTKKNNLILKILKYKS